MLKNFLVDRLVDSEVRLPAFLVFFEQHHQREVLSGRVDSQHFLATAAGMQPHRRLHWRLVVEVIVVVYLVVALRRQQEVVNGLVAVVLRLRE
jgi:hypothetical protein